MIYTRSSTQARDVEEWLETLAWLMDRSIRVGPWSIGLDGLIGLIPGFGDAAGGIISSVIVIAALQAGLPRASVLRMVANIGIDSLLGAVPFVGDIFDFAWKSNTKNVRIFREALRGERRAARDWGFLALISLVLLALLVLPLLGLIFLIQHLPSLWPH